MAGRGRASESASASRECENASGCGHPLPALGQRKFHGTKRRPLPDEQGAASSSSESESSWSLPLSSGSSSSGSGLKISGLAMTASRKAALARIALSAANMRSLYPMASRRSRSASGRVWMSFRRRLFAFSWGKGGAEELQSTAAHSGLRVGRGGFSRHTASTAGTWR